MHRQACVLWKEPLRCSLGICRFSHNCYCIGGRRKSGPSTRFTASALLMFGWLLRLYCLSLPVATRAQSFCYSRRLSRHLRCCEDKRSTHNFSLHFYTGHITVPLNERRQQPPFYEKSERQTDTSQSLIESNQPVLAGSAVDLG